MLTGKAFRGKDLSCHHFSRAVIAMIWFYHLVTKTIKYVTK